MTSDRASAAGRLPFLDGTFEGRGRWINRNAEGVYGVRYVITRSFDGTVVHAVRREFFKADGATLYVEETTVAFAPAPRNGITVVITGPKGSVAGSGYVFDNQCHYEADVSAGTRLEFTFTVGDSRVDGLASSTTKDNFTSWRETLDRVAYHPPPVADADAAPLLP
jgi:hypothetical protein